MTVFFLSFIALLLSVLLSPRMVLATPISVAQMGGKTSYFADEFAGTDIHRDMITAGDIQQGILKNKPYDVLIMPGGLSSQQYKQLGPDGRQQLLDFVKNGGGYAGFCAGAYLGSSGGTSFDPLDLANVHVGQPTNPGISTVEVQITSQSLPFSFQHYSPGQSLRILHYNGPLWDSLQMDPNRPKVGVIATFTGKDGTQKTPASSFSGKPTMIYDYYGQGRVFLSSSHPELTTGVGKKLLPDIFYWLANPEHTPNPHPPSRDTTPANSDDSYRPPDETLNSPIPNATNFQKTSIPFMGIQLGEAQKTGENIFSQWLDVLLNTIQR